MTTFGVVKKYRDRLIVTDGDAADGGPSLYREDWLAYTVGLLHSVEDAVNLGGCSRAHGLCRHPRGLKPTASWQGGERVHGG